MYLPVQRYEQIKHEVVDMYEECEIRTFPIDCFEIANRLYYILVPYSQLNDHQLRLAMEYNRLYANSSSCVSAVYQRYPKKNYPEMDLMDKIEELELLEAER